MPKQLNPLPKQPKSEPAPAIDVLAALGINLDQLKVIVDKSTKLEDDAKFFEALSAMTFAKKAVLDTLEQVESLETEAKGLINAKAKALYGNDWQVIAGEHFKISRSPTGQLYELVSPDEVQPEFLKVKFAPNAKAIDDFREANDNKLPTGVAINEHRGETIKITVKG